MFDKKSPFKMLPAYSDIFKGDSKEILAKLSTEGLAEKFIVFTTTLTSYLYADHIKENAIQERIMAEFRDALYETEDGRIILNWLRLNNMSFLNINNYSLMALFRVLLDYNKTDCINTSLSKSERLLYLKLFLIANEEITKKDNDIQKNLSCITLNAPFLYEKLFWPILLPETDVNEIIRIEYEMFRLKTIVDGIIKMYPMMESEVNLFFNERGSKDYRTFASSLVSFYLSYLVSYTNDEIVRNAIVENEQIQKLLSPLVINNVEVDSYLTIKSHPVYYYKGRYYIIHWNYLLSQIYIGTLKALQTRLSSCGVADIKKDCGLIIENTLLRNLLTISFGNLWQRVMFDEQNRGLPDAMFKMGNHLFIIELKDSLMKDSLMEDVNYEDIEKHFTETFILSSKGRKKGINQLASYILDYKNGKYGKDGFPYDKHLNIYPIIFYTDYKYRLNGLNHFLSVKFDTIVKQDITLSTINQRIRPLTLIGLDSMFNLQFKIHSKKINFANAIDGYHKHIKVREKRMANKGVEAFSQLYHSFDRYLPENKNILMLETEIKSIFKDFFGIT